MKYVYLRKRWIHLVAAMVILATTLIIPVQPANASVNYIKVDTFVKTLATMMNFDISQSSSEPYIEAVMATGILKEGDFREYSSYITRTDAAVLLNRADEYLHENTLEASLLKSVLEKRISDLNKIAETKREDVAKCVAKGIIKGYSNGYYIKTRSFKGSGYVTGSSAKAMIKLVLNPDKRARLSPDGLLIRTTNLPKNADKYDYILACYPNSFYEKKFEFMLSDDWETKRNPDYYAYPVEMKNETFKNWYSEWPLKDEMDKHLYDWEALAEKYLQYVFNVDYRTVDDEWIEGLGDLYTKSNLNEADDIRTYYIGKMKANHVVVESSIITVEPSTFYEDTDYCMRAYVKYRIIADDLSVKQSKLIYAQYPYLKGLKSGVWREGVFDIRFGTNNGSSGDGSDFTIDDLTRFIDR